MKCDLRIDFRQLYGLVKVLSLLLTMNPCSFGQIFHDVTDSSGIDHLFDYGDFHFGGGAAIIDFDNDGYEDVYITGGTNRDALYRNLGNGSFSNVFEDLAGLPTDSLVTIGALAADFNNDGWSDLYITTRCLTRDLNEWAPNVFYINNGDGTFKDHTNQSGLGADASFSTSAVAADVNGDGLLDLYVLNFLGVPIYDLVDSVTTSSLSPERPGSSNFLYLSKGDGSFEEAAEDWHIEDGGCGWATVFSDYDRDGDLDLFVANDFGRKTKSNQLYQHDAGSFNNVSDLSGFNAAINAMGVAPGDFDGDGWIDYYITDLDTNILYRNLGNGKFQDVTLDAGVEDGGWFVDKGEIVSVGWGANLFDIDHDGYLDLFVCNGALNPLSKKMGGVDTFYNANSLYHGGSNGRFINITSVAGLGDPNRGRGSVTFDYDQDGDLDLLIVNQRHYGNYGKGTKPQVKLYQNETEKLGNWIKVKLQGQNNNLEGVGSHLEIWSEGRSFVREVYAGSSHLSSESKVVHFGLGQVDFIDSLVVRWPDGYTQMISNIFVNQQILVEEDRQLTNIEFQEENRLKIFPTLSDSYFQIRSADPVLFSMVNSLGQVVYYESLVGNRIYNFSPNASGVYFWSSKSAEGKTESGRIVKL